MMRLSGRTLFTAAAVAVATVLGSTLMFDPSEAWAQRAARDLECTRCVDTGDLGNKSVNKSKLRNRAVSKAKLNPKVRRNIKEGQDAILSGIGVRSTSIVPAYVTMNYGQTKTVVVWPPYTLTARCIENVFDAGVGGNVDRIEFSAQSSQNGWLHEDSDGAAFPANTPEVISSRRNGGTGTPRYEGTGGQALFGPGLNSNFSMLSYDGEGLTTGFNILGFDCIVVGYVVVTNTE